MDHIDHAVRPADPLGTVTEAPDGTVTLRYERSLPRPIETVWAAITQPERLADWLGACTVEPHEGGRFDVFVDREPGRSVTGRVLVWDRPRTLSIGWSWHNEPETVVTFALTPDGAAATRLVFTHSNMQAARVGMVLPGWHGFLERLAVALDGGKPGPANTDRLHALQVAYGLPIRSEC